MSSITLTPKTFLNAQVSATTTPWFPVDYRFDGDGQRTLIGTRVDINDIIHLDVRNYDPETGAEAIVTATSWTNTNGTNNGCVINGQWTHMRVRKVGVSGAATFVGVI